MRAKVEALSGDLAAADRDLTASELLQSKFLALLLKYNPALAPRYRIILSGELHFHAEVLEKLGRAKEAQEKLKEAAKL
jgi:hypothetical protein